MFCSYLPRFRTAVQNVCFRRFCEWHTEPLPIEPFSNAFDDEYSRNEAVEIVKLFNKLQGLEKLPSTLTVDNVKKMITLEPMEREKYFCYLYVTEKKKKKDEVLRSRKKEEIRRRRENWEGEFGISLNENGGSQYGLWRNSMFTRLLSFLKLQSFSNNLLVASLFGQKLAFDFSFQKYMNRREVDSLCSQLKLIQRGNRKADYPFDLWFTNYERGSYYDQRLRRIMPDFDKSFININSQQSFDLFSKEKLVYLSPDSDTVLWNYDHDAVYVIGCIVDTIVDAPLTYTKSKAEHVKCVRLPIDECLEWYYGSKELPLNQVVDILRHVKDTNNWRKAMKNIASRKWNRVRKEEDIFQNIKALKKDFVS